MQDRVADILLERQALQGSAGPGLVLSVALHALLFALFLIPLARQDTTSKRSVITMRLAPSGSSGKPSRVKSGAARKPAVAKPTPSVIEPAPVVAPAASIAAASKTKVDPAQRQEKSLFGKSKGVAPPAATASRPSTPSSSTEASGQGGFAVPGIGAAGVTALEGGDFPYDAYIERMISLVGTRWFRPRLQGEPLTTLYFVIERGGAVRDVKIEKSSGNTAFDRAAFRAVREASPLPPLPFSYTGTYLGVHLTFH